MRTNEPAAPILTARALAERIAAALTAADGAETPNGNPNPGGPWAVDPPTDPDDSARYATVRRADGAAFSVSTYADRKGARRANVRACYPRRWGRATWARDWGAPEPVEITAAVSRGAAAIAADVARRFLPAFLDSWAVVQERRAADGAADAARERTADRLRAAGFDCEPCTWRGPDADWTVRGYPGASVRLGGRVSVDSFSVDGAAAAPILAAVRALDSDAPPPPAGPDNPAARILTALARTVDAETLAAAYHTAAAVDAEAPAVPPDPFACGACARIGTNGGGAPAHAPGCAHGAALDAAARLGESWTVEPIPDAAPGWAARIVGPDGAAAIVARYHAPLSGPPRLAVTRPDGSGRRTFAGPYGPEANRAAFARGVRRVAEGA